MKNLHETLKNSLVVLLVVTIQILMVGQTYAGDLDKDFRKAAEKGQIEKVKWYLKQGAKVNSTDKNGRTALMFASEKGHLDVVTLLLGWRRVDVSLKDKDGEDALDKAIKKKKNDVRLVLELVLDYEKAKEANTINAYTEFTKKYPENEFVEEVNSSIFELKYNIAVETNTIDGFKEFFREYPDESLMGHTSRSRKMMRATYLLAKLEYVQVEAINTVEAFELFIQKYPKSESAKDAKEGIARIEEKSEWPKVISNPTLETYFAFSDRFPFHHMTLTNAMLQDMAVTARKSDKYVKDKNNSWIIDMGAGIPVGSTVPPRMMSNMAMNILEKGARLECGLPKSIITNKKNYSIHVYSNEGTPLVIDAFEERPNYVLTYVSGKGYVLIKTGEHSIMWDLN